MSIGRVRWFAKIGFRILGKRNGNDYGRINSELEDEGWFISGEREFYKSSRKWLEWWTVLSALAKKKKVKQ